MKPCTVLPTLYKYPGTFKQFLNARKGYFEKQIFNNPFSLNGKTIKLIYSDNLDKCFNKFTIGSNKYHKTGTYDTMRLERLHWIDNLLNKISRCKDAKACIGIKFIKEKRNKDNYLIIFCQKNRYAIYLLDLTKKGYYVLTSAYYIHSNKKYDKYCKTIN